MTRNKKKIKAKEPVKIRFKQLSNGNKSIYLDSYVDGKREYEFLKIYIIPEVDDESRVRNSNTMRVANAIKAQRIIELANGKAGLSSASSRSKLLLSDWIVQYKKLLADKGRRKFEKQTDTTARHLAAYKGVSVRLADIDKQYCLGFVEYLKNLVSPLKQKPLSAVSVKTYCTRFSAILNMAVEEELIEENPFDKIQKSGMIKVSPKQREYLTIDEVKALIATPCRDDVVKSAFLFSCFCGLRISDIVSLTWGNIKKDNGKYRAEIVVKKTQRPLYLPLPNEALRWLPTRGDAGDADKVFELRSHPRTLAIIKKWAATAGVNKEMTYHLSRHTYATSLLTAGADLYTTSKLLGHSNVSTTQIYAKIIDQKKVDAVNLLDNVFTD